MAAPSLTCEIRWFAAGKPPVDEERMFRVHPAARTDWYLVPTSPLCGIKLREGQIEGKVRTTDPLAFHSDFLNGATSEWAKWGANWNLGVPPPGSDDEEKHWFPVAKRRWLHRFGRDAAGQIVEVGESACPRLELECAHLSTPDREAWTMCLEASGETEESRLSLLTEVARFTEEAGWYRGMLPGTDSLSYPEWLLRIAG